MATATLYPGAVTVEPFSPLDTPHPDAAVVGSTPQWADSSDATYAHIARDFSATSVATAPLDDAFAASVTALDVNVRASSTIGGTIYIGAFLYPTGAVFGDDTWALVEETSIAADGSAHDAIASLTDPEYFPVGVAALAAGATLRLQINFPNPASLTIYEASLTVTYTEAVETQPPVTRLYPRKDNLGAMASAPRLVGGWPPERRIWGSY